MSPDQFSKQLEIAFAEALKGADAIKAEAARVREEAQAELEAAREARKEAESKGEHLAREAMARAYRKLEDAARLDCLRQLARRHLGCGREAAEIAAWLGVETEFVARIERVMAKAGEIPETPPTRLPGNPRLQITQDGRSGTIYFESAETKFDVWWEFAGGSALALIDFPTPAQWPHRTGLPVERREEFARYLGERVVAEKTGGRGSFVVNDDSIVIYG